MKTSLILFLLFISFQLNAQQDKNWYFGGSISSNSAGLAFNGNTIPSPITSPSLTFKEASAVLSDDDGNLLFYSNGNTIMDRNHNPMPHGNGDVLGSISAVQGVLIAPFPGDANKYFVFCTSGQSGGVTDFTLDTGMHYSVVDMCLNGGLGDVDTLQKNIFLTDSVGEKLTAVLHQNGKDYWVITKKWGRKKYLVYPVTSTGVGNPIKSIDFGIEQGYPEFYNAGGAKFFYETGQLKVSPDGNLLVSIYACEFSPLGGTPMNPIADTNYGSILIYDFDNVSGNITNPRYLEPELKNTSYYGVAFSKSGKYIYADRWALETIINPLPPRRVDTCYSMQVNRYEVSGGNFTKTNIYNGVGASCDTQLYALELGPDGRIYMALTVNWMLPNFVSYIDNADNITPSFVHPGITMLPGSGVSLGLPNIFNFSSVLNTKSVYAGEDTAICLGANIQLGNDSIKGVSYQWTPSLELNNPNIANPIASPLENITYYLNGYTCNDTLTDTVTILVDTFPIVDLGLDTICSAIVLDASNSGSTYLWSNGVNTQTVNATTTGLYWVEVIGNSSAKCKAKDSTSVFIYDSLMINSSGQELCIGQEVVLSASGGGGVYLWYPTFESSNLIQFVPITSEEYLVISTDACKQTDTAQAIINIHNCELFIPNSFSPNGDGENDMFAIRGEGISTIEIKIYDRWGKKVFESLDPNFNWDGAYNKKLVSTGAYVYRIIVYFQNGSELSKKGNITIIR